MMVPETRRKEPVITPMAALRVGANMNMTPLEIRRKEPIITRMAVLPLGTKKNT